MGGDGQMSGGLITRWIDFLLSRPLRLFLESPERLLKKYVVRGMTALDVGCGEGLYSMGMARLVGPRGRVVSIDLDPEAIDALDKRAKQAHFGARIESRTCTDRDLGIDDLTGQVDFALAVYVVHHAEDAERLMHNVYRVLKSGGAFLVVEPRHHASAVECEDIRTMARNAGFAISDQPKLWRDWAVLLVKDDSRSRGS
jgi:ubiquinone/menaquinone biosynthesis C-methylase UbiE